MSSWSWAQTQRPAHPNAHLSSPTNTGSLCHNCPAFSCFWDVFCLAWAPKWVVLILSLKHSHGLQGLISSTCNSFSLLLCGKILLANFSNLFLVRTSFRSHYTGQLGFTYYFMLFNFSLYEDLNFRLSKSLIRIKTKFLLSYILGRFEVSSRNQAPCW